MENSIFLNGSLRSALSVVLVFGSMFFESRLVAQQYAPTLDFEKVLNTYFDDESGLISFDDSRIIFAPEGGFNGEVAVVNGANTILASFPYYKEYKVKNGVYARVQVETPADLSLTEPGIYNLVYIVDGKPVTRLPFRLELASAGNDPFNPAKTYRFDGYWRTFAFLTMGSFKGEKFPTLNYWLGGIDLVAGQVRGAPYATMYRDGELVAHSKRGVGIIQPGHFKPVTSNLYHPHPEAKAANAKPFLLKNWLVDGTYEIRVSRKDDDTLLRSFDFKVVNGAIEEHPRTKLGYLPQTDYIAPRVQKKGSTTLELTEAIWIEDRQIK